MKAYSVFVFLICLNISIYILGASNTLGVQYPKGYTNPESIPDLFKIENLNLTDIFLLSGATIFTGLLMLFTKQYFWASVALLLWVVAILFKPIGWVVTGFPLMVGSVMEGVGVPTATALTFQVALTAFYVFIMFMFLVEILTQRQIT